MSISENSPPLTGAAYIRDYAARLTSEPGVYRMLDAGGQVLYVGKARNLKKRVASYASRGALHARTLRMVAATAAMEVITTRSEAEALLVEASLIKKLKPVYNILFRDDKSYPFILLTGDHDFPRIVKHRGARKKKGEYYGPFASVGAVNQTLSILQRAFLLRPCSDNIFSNRSRPCLQYQIKRCAAPCVGYVDKEEYGALIAQAQAFLSGRSREIQEELLREMQALSEAEQFEKAAVLRDRIRALTRVQQEQGYGFASLVDTDVIALAREGGGVCVQVMFFRGGQAFGSRSFFPAQAAERGEAELMEAFIGQFYQAHPPPAELLLSHAPAQAEVLEEALSLHAGRKVRLHVPQRGEKHTAVEQAELNARHALAMHLTERRSERANLEAVAELFGLAEAPARIEVYDNSHIMGTHAVGAMIVAGPEGFDKKSYRRFTIRRETLTPGDDYAMLREVLTRRFGRLVRENAALPDLVLIDGGAGQMGVAREVFAELGVELPYAGIAKGPDRHAGREQFFMPGRAPFRLPPGTPALHYLQRLRDEAHRFAISSHRIKRANALRVSALDDIPGVGPGRKKALLHHFGSRQGVEEASLDDLAAVPGISRKTAQAIHDYFRG